MKLGSIFYAIVCLFALVCLARGNMQGYVPFVANAVSAAHGAANSLSHK